MTSVIYTEHTDMEGMQERSFVDELTPKVLLVLLFLLPFFFIPAAHINLVFGKTALFIAGTMLALIAWGINTLRTASLRVPHLLVLLLTLLLPAVYTVAAFFGPSTRTSLIGNNLPLDSVFVVASLALLALLVASVSHTKKQLLSYYGAFAVSLLVVGAIQLVRLIGGPSLLSFGILTTPTASVIGKWNDLAVLFGLGAITSLIAIATLSLNRNMKVFTYVVLLVSWFFLMLVNFQAVWYAVGGVALLMLVYILSFKRAGAQSTPMQTPDDTGVGQQPAQSQLLSTSQQVLIPLVITLIIGGIFIFASTTVGGFLSNTFNATQVEVRPSFNATWRVAQDVLADNPLFGVGPARFSSAWLMHKPAGINETAFWQVEFAEGIGALPSTLVTSGILGTLSWIVLILLVLYLGGKMLIHKIEDPTTRFLALASFVGALYLWAFMCIYTSGITLRALTFFFTGMTFATVYLAGRNHPITFHIPAHPAWNFVTTLILLVFIFVGALGVYTVAERVGGEVLFRDGVIALNQGNADAAQNELLRATQLFPSDLYERSLAGAYVLGIQQILQDQETPQDVLINRFQVQLGNAVTAAQRAIAIDENNYVNWMALGNIYELVAPLNIEGAYEGAADAYSEAETRNPGPDIFLAEARLAAQSGDTETAQAFVKKALTAKTNYIDAVFFLAQIQLNEGNVAEAIRSVEVAAQVSPTNPIVFFQLGVLRYGNGQYNGAISALETAVSLSPVYANAKYFLGLAYDQVGRTEDAIAQFEGILETNPDNQEVQTILENLRAGRPALGAAATTPVQQEALPLQETVGSDPEETDVLE